VGEEVVLFLAREEGWSRPGVVGFHLGKYRVERNEDGQITALVRGVGQRPGAEDQEDRRVSLDELIQEMFSGPGEKGSFSPAPSEGDEIHPLSPEER